MKTSTLFLAPLLVLVFTACASNSKKETAITSDLDAATQSVREQGKKKNDFIHESQNRIAEIEKNMTDFKEADLRNPDRNSKAASAAVSDAERALESARAELRDLRDTNATNWVSEQQDFIGTMKKLEERFARAKGYFQTY